MTDKEKEEFRKEVREVLDKDLAEYPESVFPYLQGVVNKMKAARAMLKRNET